MWHRIRHWLHWQPIEIVTEWRHDDGELWLGARCVICGKVSGWHIYSKAGSTRCRPSPKPN